MHFEPTILRRIFSRTKRDPQSGCWVWQGAKFKKGYGAINVQRQMHQTHRAVYLALHPAEPPPENVCHHCDNPPCVRPSHLYGGTPKTNANDRVARGRQGMRPRKEPSFRHSWEIIPFNWKLSWWDVHKIRYLAQDCGETERDIARRFKISPLTVRRVLASDFWPPDLKQYRPPYPHEIPPLPGQEH